MNYNVNADGSFGSVGANVDLNIPINTIVYIVLACLIIFAGFFLMKKYIH